MSIVNPLGSFSLRQAASATMLSPVRALTHYGTEHTRKQCSPADPQRGSQKRRDLKDIGDDVLYSLTLDDPKRSIQKEVKIVGTSHVVNLVINLASLKT
jgi:hypothetical protein